MSPRLHPAPGDAGVPPPAPRPMPSQNLAAWRPERREPPDPRTRALRAFVFGGAALLAVFGFQQMLAVFDPARVSALQILLLGLFTVTFAWIGFAALAALAGLALARPLPVSGGDPGRTALVMLLYDEDPATSVAALEAMAEGLAATGAGDRFEVFVLSDTRDPDVWVRETAAIARLRAALSGRMAVWYRRRMVNAGRKAGNIRDFVERWGGRYEAMLVLDADSVMAPGTILELTARMAADPRLGILQTTPLLAGGTSLFARLQQFAGRLYGPVIARGTAAWQGQDGNYWGHNALIRVRAFAETCGLPDLPGRRPWGGLILSHDFVEAALMRRAGWRVRMDPDLGGSYEGSPPSLVDLAARDRRWAQGNLQHARVIASRGLAWPSRVHLAIGIAAYLMSPVWLALLMTGAALTLQGALVAPRYFADTLQLFPTWPVFDAGRMLTLLAVAMALLLLPKLLGLAAALRRTPGLRARLGLLGGFATEIVLSALYAPVLMLMQVAQLAEILRGRDSGWSAQSRDGGPLPWRAALARHWHHSLAGLAAAALFALLAPPQLVWLSPVLAGLALAPLASRLSGSAAAGAALARAGLLVTPEEREPPAILARVAALRAGYAAATRQLDLSALASDPAARARHAALAPRGAPTNRLVWLADITARAKIGAVADPDAALALMNRDERLALAGSPELLERWARRESGLAAPTTLAGE